MRTTLALDDDVLAAARAIAQREGRSLGDVVSSLAREALLPRRSAEGAEAAGTSPPASRSGVPLLVTRDPGRPVTMELVNQLRDEA